MKGRCGRKVLRYVVKRCRVGSDPVLRRSKIGKRGRKKWESGSRESGSESGSRTGRLSPQKTRSGRDSFGRLGCEALGGIADVHNGLCG